MTQQIGSTTLNPYEYLKNPDAFIRLVRGVCPEVSADHELYTTAYKVAEAVGEYPAITKQMLMGEKGSEERLQNVLKRYKNAPEELRKEMITAQYEYACATSENPNNYLYEKNQELKSALDLLEVPEDSQGPMLFSCPLPIYLTFAFLPLHSNPLVKQVLQNSVDPSEIHNIAQLVKDVVASNEWVCIKAIAKGELLKISSSYFT